jgi:uncharacterized membrane protein
LGENHFSALPSALYGAVMLMAAVAYYLLQTLIIRAQGGCDSRIAQAIGSDLKGKLSPVLYAAAIGLSFVRPWIAGAIYVVGALLWLIPDRRLLRAATNHKSA